MLRSKNTYTWILFVLLNLSLIFIFANFKSDQLPNIPFVGVPIFLLCFFLILKTNVKSWLLKYLIYLIILIILSLAVLALTMDIEWYYKLIPLLFLISMLIKFLITSIKFLKELL